MRNSGLAMLAAMLAMSDMAAAQVPDVSGQWFCEYATRNIYREDAHAVYYQANFNFMPGGQFQAQGQAPGWGGFQAQGTWELQQDEAGLAISARGQRTDAMMGANFFAFDSYVQSATWMNYSHRFASGDEIASQCRR